MKVLFSFLILIVTSTLLYSCESKIVNEETCDLESMKCYRGYPHSCDFIKKCTGVEHKFTKKLCSKAFNELYMGGNSKAVIETYTPKILHCFNDKEFINFNIDKKLRPKE